jgi:hypothetical protein
MASDFGLEDPVLDFNPRRSKEHGTRDSWEYVLWPAWAYRVVAPSPRRRKLNTFQRAIMGLCRAGLNNNERVAEKLAVHQDLAAFILIELTELGYLDSYGIPTERGLAVIAGDEDDDHDLVCGFVFQDPWTGELWPRFVEQLNYCELEYRDNGFPQLVRGSKGKRRLQSAFMVIPDRIPDPSRPTPKQVMLAVAGQRRAIRQVNQLAEPEDEHDVEVDLSPVRLGRVSFIEDQAAPVFLTTYFYLTGKTGNVADSKDWYACDPFGMGTSNRLRRSAETVMQGKRPLLDVVDRLVAGGVHGGIEEHRAYFELLRMKASRAVDRRLSLNIRVSSAYEELVEMELQRQHAISLGRSCGDTQLKAGLRGCLKSLEALFAGMAQDYPLGDIWRRVYVERTNKKTGRCDWVPFDERKLIRAEFLKAAEQVGFSSSVPESFLNVKPGQVRNVADRGDHWRLRPLVAATLLKAQEDAEHPLRSAAARDPNLLADIDKVAEAGGAAGHAGRSKGSFDDLDDIIESTYKIADVLTGHSPAAKSGAASADGADHGEA